MLQVPPSTAESATLERQAHVGSTDADSFVKESDRRLSRSTSPQSAASSNSTPASASTYATATASTRHLFAPVSAAAPAFPTQATTEPAPAALVSTSSPVASPVLTSLMASASREDRATMAFAQTLLRRMLSDQVSEKHYDVYFIVRTRERHDDGVRETRLGAHRVVLSAVSDQFERYARPMSTSSSACSASTGIDEIVISDCSAAAIREALRLIYGGEPDDALQTVSLSLDLWRFGVNFHVDHLIALARSACLANLSTDNCLRILDFAVHVDDVQIVDKLQNYASENSHFAHVISSPHFQYLDFDVISSLVRPGKGQCAWPDILTFEKVWFDALAKWLALRVLSSIRREQQRNRQAMAPLLATATDSEPTPEPSKDSASSVSAPSNQHSNMDNHILEEDEPDDAAASNSAVDDDDSDEDDEPETPRSNGNVQALATPENVLLVEKILDLVDFSRMKTHELRDVSHNPVASISPVFHRELVDILLTRTEELEASVLERNIDLDVIGQKYQQALCEQDEAERKARAAVEKMDKLQAAKVSLERRMEDMRRKKPTTVTGSSGPASLNSARRKMSGSSTII